MLNRVVHALACPHCGAALTQRERALLCTAGHTFDIAKQGYVNLLPGATKHSADTREMVEARAEFLAAGHYAPLSGALVELARRTADPAVSGCVVDIGGGTGYYHARVMDALPDAAGVLLDISKFAARRAAKAHPRISAAVADAWQQLPLQDGAASLVLNTFAPRNGSELRRILAPGGALLVVTARPGHLQELVDALGLLRVDDRKESRLTEQLAPYFTLAGTERLTRTMTLDHRALTQLVAMGPNAWHHDAGDVRERVRKLPDPCPVTLSVTLTAWRPAACAG